MAATVPLALDAGSFEGSGLVDGACYYATATRSPALRPAPLAPSGSAFCGTPTACVPLVEGEWGREPATFFKPLLTLPQSDNTFDVRVRLPAANAGGLYLVNGDTSAVEVNLRSLPTTPTTMSIELRSKGFRGDARVGKSVNFGVPSSWYALNAVPNISRWVDRGDDGWTYTSWGDTLREDTQFCA